MIKEVNIGYEIPNLLSIARLVDEELGIESEVYLMPMKVTLDQNAYVFDGGANYIVFLSERILKKDKASNKNIRILIHEMTHVKQMEEGDLVMGQDKTRVVWKGRVYTNKDNYDSRPFEVEARSNEIKYLNIIKRKLPKGKCKFSQ